MHIDKPFTFATRLELEPGDLIAFSLRDQWHAIGILLSHTDQGWSQVAVLQTEGEHAALAPFIAGDDLAGPILKYKPDWTFEMVPTSMAGTTSHDYDDIAGAVFVTRQSAFLRTGKAPWEKIGTGGSMDIMSGRASADKRPNGSAVITKWRVWLQDVDRKTGTPLIEFEVKPVG